MKSSQPLQRIKEDLHIYAQVFAQRVSTKWRWLAGSVVLLVLAACSAAATNCDLTTFVVNANEDLDDGACDAAHCSLREAVNAANACSVRPAYTIELPAGDYELTLRGPGERGDLNIDSVMVINGMGASPSETIIRGEDNWVYSIFSISGDGDLILSNVTIEGGNTTSDGGAIYNEGRLNTDDVIFSNNRAEGNGGAIYNAGYAKISEGSVIENRANGVSGCGGGIYNSGQLNLLNVTISFNESKHGRGVCNSGRMDLRTTTISSNGKNSTYYGSGGGIYTDGGYVLIIDSTIDDNYATQGGGIFSEGFVVRIEDTIISNNLAEYGAGLYAGPGAANIELYRVTVEGNQAIGGPFSDQVGQGGGLYLMANSFYISDTLVRDNFAAQSGGGFFIDLDNDLDSFILHSAIVSNTARDGGGGLFARNSHLVIENTTISRNISQNIGGQGLHNGPFAETRLIHVTVSEHASLTAVVNVDGRIYFQNTLLGNNWEDCGGDLSGLVTEGGNAADGPDGCNFSQFIDATFLVTGSDFLPVTEVKGTWVNPLLASHPAVDFVSVGNCSEPYDQRRLSRPQGAGCDIGAYEVEVVEISGEGDLELETVTPTIGPIVAIITTNARCRTGPGFVYGDYDFFNANDSTTVYARVADSSWYQVQAPNLSGKCWVGQAVLEFDVTPEVLQALLVLQPPATPTFTPAPAAPESPSGLQATETACNAVDGYKVKLTWNDNSNNESGFRIYHNGALVATVGANVEQYTHTVPDNYAQQQSYYVAAYNDAGSANSNTATEDGCLY